MVKRYTGYDEYGEPQSEDEYLYSDTPRGFLPLAAGLCFAAFVVWMLLGQPGG